MPLIKEWESDEYSLCATWKMEEPEAFFAASTGLTPDIKNEKRRIERLAGRHLLQYLKNDFPLHGIAPDEHDKPRIPANQYFFSVSHSYPYAAAVVSPYAECGIDIQCWHPRILQIQHKFLSEKEQQLFGNDEQLVTLAWCAKEAAYKWNGRRETDFIQHLPITAFILDEEYKYTFLINIISSGVQNEISLKGFLEKDYALSYVINKIDNLVVKI